MHGLLSPGPRPRYKQAWRGGHLDPHRLKELGVEPGYFDHRGQWREVPEATLRTIAALVTRAPEYPGPLSVRPGDHLAFPRPVTLRLEDGTLIDGVSELSPDIPLGYHRVLTEDRERLLIVSPGVCYLPDELRCWGWTVQLYAMRSQTSWGIGDLGDLEEFGRAARGEGAAVALINPLHADKLSRPREPSPYFPSSRGFREPMYLDVERVPGISELEGIEDLIAAGRALNDSKRVDRDRVLEAKMTALERLWRRSPDVEGPGAFARELGEPLELFATHCALVEKYGREAGSWPSGLRTARSAEVQRFRNSNADRVQFHVWLQWLVDEQLKSAASKMGVIHDLAVGVGPDGADAWTWPGCFTEGITIGAPPDDYSSEGQDWGVAGFDPVQLAAADFEPFIAMVRATMRHAAGIRFDHVMSLFRLFWIPEGLGPSNGCYVRYPSRELLDILSLESHRAETFVIGEDLGTVEEGVRDETHRRKMMSSRLLWFEESDARTLGRLAMASSNTHDLPTTAGLWTGEEVAAQRRRGIEPNVEFLDTMIERIHRHLGVERDAPVDAVIDAAAELLAGSECAVVTVGIEDVVGSVERYNLPGSTGEQNWTTVLPVALEELVRHPRFAAISDLFNRGRR